MKRLLSEGWLPLLMDLTLWALLVIAVTSLASTCVATLASQPWIS